MFILTILALVFFGGETNEEWSIDYIVTHEGPRVVYSGTVWLHCDENQTEPCINYCFDVPENGRLAGPVISSNPGEAIIPFDNYVYKGKLIGVVLLLLLPFFLLAFPDILSFMSCELNLVPMMF